MKVNKLWFINYEWTMSLWIIVTILIDKFFDKEALLWIKQQQQ